ncbi:MAG: hypothetical protein AAB478_04180 [Patescibacteria group bacterium]
MKIYISHNRKQFNYKKELYEPLKNSQLSKDHIFIFPHDNNPQSFNAKDLFQNKGCDLVIAEVSYPATGQGIELAWANMYQIPIVCIYKQGSDISGSLSFITSKFLMYTDTQNMIEDIAGFLRQYE